MDIINYFKKPCLSAMSGKESTLSFKSFFKLPIIILKLVDLACFASCFDDTELKFSPL